jgi:predicted transcriptional regulator of viral defense system
VLRHAAVRRRDAASVGIDARALTAKVAEGDWERLGRGIYAPTDRGDIPWHALHEVQRYAPRVVFCLETALAFHDLTDVRPRAVWIALARGMRRPAIRWVRIEVVTVAANLWELGVAAYPTEAGDLRVTNVARTIVDCFRFRRRLGLEIALGALREARASDRVSPGELLSMARLFRQERIMLPYVEAVR